jgi:hypothetical protein
LLFNKGPSRRIREGECSKDHLHLEGGLQLRGDLPRGGATGQGIARGDRFQTLLGVTAPARPSPWPTSSPASADPPWWWRPTRH